ncbi:unnamed protein product, partial [Polarella glacialis]
MAKSRSSSSSSSSSSKSSDKRLRKKREQEKKDFINARMNERIAQRESEESAWQGWICPCGGKNFVMKGRCFACNGLKPLNAQQRGIGQAAQAIEKAREAQAPKSKFRSRSRSRSVRK